MVNDTKYFYLSGLISFLLFFTVIFLFIYTIVMQDKIKTFALKKDTYVSISLNTIDTSKIKNDTKKPIDKIKPKPTTNKKPKEKKSEKVDKPKPSPDVKENRSASNLFSKVKTKQIAHKGKKIIKKFDAKKLNTINKRITTAKASEKTDASEKLEKLDLQEKISEVGGQSVSRAPEVDVYFAKVHAFVYSNFHPNAQSANQIAKVRINLSSSGKMSDFKVLVLSSDESLNEEIERLRQRLLRLTFPQHPDNKAIDIDIILKAKE